MYNGILNVYKEAGFTSHDVVAKLRGIFKQKKIGHTGTLDPDAVGVLPVCFGSGTKLCDMLTGWKKEYIAVLQLGVTTDTQDMSGRVLSCAEEGQLARLTEEKVRSAILGFQGAYDQIPPMYSARKVGGKKLYEFAREGKEVERQPKRVWIEEIEIQKTALPNVTMRVVCSKGTYIRTLCHDIGAELGCGGAMRSLVRSRVGIFEIGDALTIGQITDLFNDNKIANVLIKPDVIFADKKAVSVTAEGVKAARNGNVLESGLLQGEIPFADGEQIRVYDGGGKFYGIYGYHAREGLLKPVRMFLERE